MNDKRCERCLERPGETNSQYLFDNPMSTPPDLGDWVCYQCEQELADEHEDLFCNDGMPDHKLGAMP